MSHKTGARMDTSIWRSARELSNAAVVTCSYSHSFQSSYHSRHGLNKFRAAASLQLQTARIKLFAKYKRKINLPNRQQKKRRKKSRAKNLQLTSMLEMKVSVRRKDCKIYHFVLSSAPENLKRNKSPIQAAVICNFNCRTKI